MTLSNTDIEQRLIQLLGQRAAHASICPSDVARSLVRDEAEWRALMPSVRRAAARLAHEGKIIVTQGETTLNPDSIDHGPIRLRRGPKFPSSA